MAIMNLHDFVEENGKTIKENNLEKQHKFLVGDLVEIQKSGVRMFVVAQTRDCDGTPLYSLCPNKDNIVQERKGFANYGWHNGYSEYGMILIK